MEIIVCAGLVSIIGMLWLIVSELQELKREKVKMWMDAPSNPKTTVPGGYLAGDRPRPIETLGARMTPSEISRDLREKARRRAQEEANRKEREGKNALQ